MPLVCANAGARKMTEKPIKCNCGKLLARVRDGKVYVWCKACKKEIQLKTERS
jgi:hypothetical protein